ncbi:cupin domain-containing protein [Parasphingopyxis sp.]|uniref:cupin domain-containing protein n=1 Tax=Parasphingopyxis sp. TaxID=1920299 RepID=UPI00260C9894|nr:cupin domain-containing protein [Parasphingopyxis sp.]
MRINADFSKPAIVRPGDVDWTASPVEGVDRKMLDRVGEEVARATSIVRYAPGSHFSEHEHGGGEEFFVLDGTFSDETGDFPAGTYVRNPIGTRHTPHSDEGCTIFVKLHQFDAEDTEQFAVQTRTAEFQPGQDEGLTVLPLHRFGAESVALIRYAPGTRATPDRRWGGEEILVLEGVLQDERGTYPAGTWLRYPHLWEGSDHFSEKGCLFYVKTGYLTPEDS